MLIALIYIMHHRPLLGQDIPGLSRFVGLEQGIKGQQAGRGFLLTLRSTFS